MELKEIIDFFKRNLKNLGFSFLLGIGLGGAVFFIYPEKFISTGTLYISRATEESSDFYTYSGYYAQQVALSYTNTVKGLLENNILRAKALEELGISVTEDSLRKLDRKMRVKDSGPQLVSLEIKENTPEKAKKTWNALTSNIETTSVEINQKGDPKLNITPVKEEPVVSTNYKNIYVFSLIGGLLALGAGTLYFALKTYMEGFENEENK